MVASGRPVFVYEIDWTEQRRQPSLGLVAATAQCSGGQEELTTLIIMRLLDVVVAETALDKVDLKMQLY